ncbi:helix-turn-helix domain-containing protein [Pseudoalteromonas sp. SMS1]|uniref:helix-turn-helix domain-containing protein n=1 Tax=Pseudoalteromonas sp. SMS1 TaxID=2908894 RepID=UPI001F245D45|nr:helix-turn-helix transcriptional regulator [Pseudoalteromonas sp. SMS1]MCF2857917.1 helix-turn-helix domain-containing protein [Pseudoalteromonas sp. SMS1]
MAKQSIFNAQMKVRLSQRLVTAQQTPDATPSSSELVRTPKGAQLLKYARKCRGFTQAESAACYGIEERTLRRWENNEYNPRWNDVISLIEDVYLMNITQAIEGVRNNPELIA